MFSLPLGSQGLCIVWASFAPLVLGFQIVNLPHSLCHLLIKTLFQILKSFHLILKIKIVNLLVHLLYLVQKCISSFMIVSIFQGIL